MPDWVNPGGADSTIGGNSLVDGLHEREQRRASRHRELESSNRPWTPPGRRGSPTPDRSERSNMSSTPSCGRRVARQGSPSGPGSATGAVPNAGPPTPRKPSSRRRADIAAIQPTAHQSSSTSTGSAAGRRPPRPTPSPSTRLDITDAARSASSTRSSTPPTPTPTGSTATGPDGTPRHAVETLTEVARHAPSFARHPGRARQDPVVRAPPARPRPPMTEETNPDRRHGPRSTSTWAGDHSEPEGRSLGDPIGDRPHASGSAWA